jgi:hypothetical protein
MKKILIAFLALTSISLMAQSLEFGGFIRNNTGMILNEDLDFSDVKNTFNLKSQYYGEMGALNAEMALESTGTDELEFGVKEIYIDLYFNVIDLRIGKQQIIWGKADGVFITDVVSPKDLSDFILPDFDEIRIGVNALKADYYLDLFDIEFVWVPEFIPTIRPEGIWESSYDLGSSVTINDTVQEDSTLENSEFFAKMSYMGSFIDIELMGAYMWDDNATPHLTGTMEFTPEYSRVVMGGGSFSSDISGLIFRGEGAFYKGKEFHTDDSSVDEMVVEKNFIHYMLGLDYSFSGFALSTQFIQEIILDYDNDMSLDNEFQSTMTFMISKKLFNETLLLEFFSYIGLTDSDALLRPKITYDLADGLELLLGGDIFIGDEGNFGQYNDNNRIYTKLKYSF